MRLVLWAAQPYPESSATPDVHATKTMQRCLRLGRIGLVTDVPQYDQCTDLLPENATTRRRFVSVSGRSEGAIRLHT